jgi:hypothetical protein
MAAKKVPAKKAAVRPAKPGEKYGDMTEFAPKKAAAKKAVKKK